MSVSIVAAPRALDRRWLVLTVVAAAQFMFVVDAFVVNVAIPSIRGSLNATTAEIQGVIVLYQLAFATLIITGGRLGDIYGPKPAFLTGLAGFTAASVWCGLAGSGLELDLARATQGAAAALMIPQVLATIHVLFPDAERGRAFGVFGFTLGFGGAAGVALGGWLIALDPGAIGWRAIFFVNLPIGIGLMAAAVWLMPNVESQHKARVDLVGALLLCVAMLCILGPLLAGDDLGWPIWLAAIGAGGFAMLAVFWLFECWIERRGGAPLVSLELLRNRQFVAGLAAVFCFTFANLSFYLVLTLYMQLGRGWDALVSGSVMLPLALTFAVVSRFAGPRAQRRGVRALWDGCAVQALGLLVVASGVGLTDAVTPVEFALLLVVFGAGQAMVMAPLYGLVLTLVPRAHAGSGGGVVSTVQQIGNATGVAAVGAVYYTLQEAGSARFAFLLSVALLIAAVVITALFLVLFARSRLRS